VGVLQFRARPLAFPSAASAEDFSGFETWVKSLPAAERGPAWEAFTEAYLCHTPALDVKDVWRPSDPYLPDVVLAKLGLERKDVGQDFVVRTRSGSLWIVQAKFRSRGELTWEDVKGAVAAGRNADRVLFVSNALTLGGNCPPALLNQHVGAVLRHDLIGLGRDFFDRWEAARAGKALRANVAQGRREQQIAAIASVTAELRGGASRTQLIAACGTGKTRMGLWVMEDLSAERVLFFAPSLALVSQSVGEWTTHAAIPIDVVCVCSDNTAGEMSAYEFAVPVTTRAAELRARWEAPLEPGRRRVVFSTYHSAPVVRDALRNAAVALPELMVCDEAPRIAGDEDKSWQLVLDDAAIPARRRLFMTATPKLVSDELKAAGVGASMDDESLFGRVAHRITFRDAINAGMLADYRIHVIGVPTSERRVRDMVRRRKFVLVAVGSVFTPTLNGR
jgi:predicted helicase